MLFACAIGEYSIFSVAFLASVSLYVWYVFRLSGYETKMLT